MIKAMGKMFAEIIREANERNMNVGRVVNDVINSMFGR